MGFKYHVLILCQSFTYDHTSECSLDFCRFYFWNNGCRVMPLYDCGSKINCSLNGICLEESMCCAEFIGNV